MIDDGITLKKEAEKHKFVALCEELKEIRRHEVTETQKVNWIEPRIVYVVCVCE